MVDKKKIEELEKAIKAKQAELDSIYAEQENSAADASRYATLEKKEKRIKSELTALQLSLKIVTYTLEPLSDQEELLSGIEVYRKEYHERIAKIQEEIDSLDAELEDIEKKMGEAAAEANVKETLKLSNRKDEILIQKPHLEEMRRKAEMMPVYPTGVIEEEWKKICDILLPEWNTKVTALLSAAEAYKTMVQDLVAMKCLISATRAILESLAGTTFDPVFTSGNEFRDAVIEKGITVTVINLFRTDPLSGRRI